MRLFRVCIAAVTAATFAGIATPALADPSGSASGLAAQATAVVQQVTGTAGIAPSTQAAAGATASATVSAPGGTVTVTAPATAGGRVAVTAPDGTAVTLTLPAASDAAGTTSAAGTTVYPGAGADTDLAVQATDDGGARALVTLNNAGASTEQRFDLGLPQGASLVPDGKGGYDIVQALGNGASATMGHIDAPWAKDANGNPVPTNYHLDGTTLVQSIETGKDTAYPVVADPKWTWGWITGTVYFNKHDTGHVATNAAFVAVLFAAAPPPFDAYGILNSANISRVAGNAQTDNKCVEIKIPTFIPSEYSGGYCK